MPDAQGRLESFLTLVLEHADVGLSAAHRELYPERIPEKIPLSLTLLYPWIPARRLTDADLARVREFFASRPPLTFDLVRVTEFPGVVAYAVPEPDDELRATMKALWALYPEYPPYGRKGNCPTPHCTLGRLEGDQAVTLEQARARVEPLLPVRCEVTEATLFVEAQPVEMRVRATFPFGA
ncbi:MAG: 2'-5' RNA ligase family protein [Gaiellaceae bacterium]